MQILPKIMVAPNGARLTQSDHPALPVSIPEIVDTAANCFAAGADGIHVHVRDAKGAHVLDAGLYLELTAELKMRVPEMAVQITTEAVGQYSPDEQIRLVKDVEPVSVSIAARELSLCEDKRHLREFLENVQSAEIAVQHILYSPDDFDLLNQMNVATDPIQLLFVLGRYTENMQSAPEMLDPFLAKQRVIAPNADWAVCAFGQRETDCLVYAANQSGKVRVGFENNTLRPDGTIAASNEERVADLKTLLEM